MMSANLRPSALSRVFSPKDCLVSVYDPAAMEKARVMLPANANLRYAGDEFEAAHDAHALLVVTEWPQFARLISTACIT